MSLGPKNGLERRDSRISTICAKIHVLKLNVDNVTVLLRLNSHFWCPPPFLYSCSIIMIRMMVYRSIRKVILNLVQLYGCYNSKLRSGLLNNLTQKYYGTQPSNRVQMDQNRQTYTTHQENFNFFNFNFFCGQV